MCETTVTINYDDRAQVERLEATMADALGWTLLHNSPRVDGLQAALREFANPTPPKQYVTAEMVEVIRNQVAADRARAYWKGEPHESKLNAVDAWLDSLADHLGVTE